MQLLAVTRLTRLYDHEITGTIKDNDDTIRALLCSVGEDFITGILLGLLIENIGGKPYPIGALTAVAPINLQSVS